MIEPENKLSNGHNGWATNANREQERLQALSDSGLRQSETIPVFEEATQTAAHYLEAPICILGFVEQDRYCFKSAVGLSRLGLMNQLAQTRQLPRTESFCTEVVESGQIVVINDTQTLEERHSILIHEYGIRAYLGVPLFDGAGFCLGTLSVMDLIPRHFTNRDIEFLQIIARWSMSEFERNRLLKVTSEIASPRVTTCSHDSQPLEAVIAPTDATPPVNNNLKLQLLEQLTQELRTPLTSVLGMASVLGREIYGPLTMKQKEYLEIIQHSGRYLLSMVNEIAELGTLDESTKTLNLAPVDIEMLCQQAINTLEEAASRRDQDLRLSIEPGRSRIWVLDKDKVRQLLYHLIFSVIQVAATGSVVRVHVSYKEEGLNLTIWVSHPWLGDGLVEVDPYFTLTASKAMVTKESAHNGHEHYAVTPTLISTTDHATLSLSSAGLLANGSRLDLPKGQNGNLSRESLGLLLSCQLAELHGGQISIQGSSESGYRYVVYIPLQAPAEVDD
jgi:signal transduction histidine kinase